ncbi:MAG: hypothetical protein IJA14_00485 [Alphaproteobacteria bacterium]|nr:hypothetical protein [Alphaproteobacteria bacterium]
MMLKQEIFSFCEQTNLNWSDFIESEENHEALMWLMRWPDWPGFGIILTGAQGVGKSHLAALWAQSANAVYVLPHSLNHDPRELFQGESNFVIDNISEFLCNEEWLFDFYNIVKEKKRYLLLIDRDSPSNWNISLKDLRSRIMSLPRICIRNYGDEMLVRICQKIAKDIAIDISDRTLEYIVQTYERDISSLTNILRTLNKLSLKIQKPISVPFVKKYLSELR